MIVRGDESGGEHGDDARYRRCGWSCVVMEKIGTTWGAAATVAGSLPGPRQSNNRAEITAFLDCMQTTEGCLIFYTDSDIPCKGWHSKRYFITGYKKAMGDLCKKMRQIISTREVAEVRARHIESHMSREQATDRGVRIEAWKGNENADQLAGEAAASHGISEAQMGC
eukprot:3938750-Pyramimonas_sp.AAC.1